jgi:WD40 repeat protein
VIDAHKGEVTGIAAHPRAEVLATCGHDNRVQLWDMNATSRVESREVNAPVQVTFSPDGSMLAVACKDGTVHVWRVDPKNGILSNDPPHRLQPPRDRTSYPPAVAFAPGAPLLAAADGTQVTFWDTSSWRQVGSLSTVANVVSRVCFSPDGGRIAVAAVDQVSLYNIRGGQALAHPVELAQVGVYPTSVGSIAFSPDGISIAGGKTNGAISLWNASNLKARDRGENAIPGNATVLGILGGRDNPELPERPLVAHHLRVREVTYTPLRELLLSVSDDGVLAIWSAGGAPSLGKWFAGPVSRGRADAPRLYQISPDCTLLASAQCTKRQKELFFEVPFGKAPAPCLESQILLWDIPGERRISPALPGPQSEVAALAFSPEGNAVGAAGRDGSVWLYNAKTRQSLGAPLMLDGPVRAMAIGPNGDHLAVAVANRVELWDVPSRSATRLFDIQAAGTALAFDASGRQLAAGDAAGIVHLWKLATDRSHLTLDTHRWSIGQLAFDPQGEVLAASAGRDLAVWHFRDPPVVTRMPSQSDAINTLAFSPDGRVLASAGWGPRITLWGPRTAAPIGAGLLGRNQHRAIAFGREGTSLVALDIDGNFRRWDMNPRSWVAAASFLVGRNLTEAERFQYLANDPVAAAVLATPIPAFPAELGKALRLSKAAAASGQTRPSGKRVAVEAPSGRTVSVNFMNPYRAPASLRLDPDDLLILGGAIADAVVYVYRGEPSLAFTEQGNQFFVNGRLFGARVAAMADLDKVKGKGIEFVDLRMPLTAEVAQRLSAAMPALRGLRIAAGDLRPEGLQRWPQFTELERLLITRARQPRADGGKPPSWEEVVGGVRLPAKLTVLQLQGVVVSDRACKELMQLGGLRHLDVSGCEFPAVAAALSPGGLRSLKLSGTNVNDDHVKALQPLKELRCLDLSRTAITDEAMTVIGDFSELEALSVNFTPVGDYGCRALAKLSKLRDLDVGWSQITDGALANLRDNEVIERVEAFSTNISDRGAAALGRLPTLRRVGIGQTELSDEGVTQLRHLPDLEDLDLGFLNRVTNAAVIPFTGSKSLRSLRLERGFNDGAMLYVGDIQSLEVLNLQCPISDKGLDALANLPKLRRVAIRGDRVSDAAIEQLKRARPGLDVRVFRLFK